MRITIPTPDDEPPAAKIRKRTDAVYVRGTITVRRDGRRPQGSMNAAATKANTTTEVAVSQADPGPGGRARLAMASPDTTANGMTRETKPSRSHGPPAPPSTA